MFEKARGELNRTAQERGAYDRVLRSLIKEAAAELTGRLIIEANPADADAARAATRELGLDAEVKPSPEVSGGVVLSTTDGRFTVQEVECLGACGFATPILIDNDFIESVTPDKVPGLLAGYR